MAEKPERTHSGKRARRVVTDRAYRALKVLHAGGSSVQCFKSIGARSVRGKSSYQLKSPTQRVGRQLSALENNDSIRSYAQMVFKAQR